MKSIDITVIFFFLKRDVDNGFRDFVSHFFKMFSFFNEDFEIIRKINIIVISFFGKNFLFEEIHGSINNFIRPGLEFFFLININNFS
jgi:hypothetical protein